jgi:hypothetical protein
LIGAVNPIRGLVSQLGKHICLGFPSSLRW